MKFYLCNRNAIARALMAGYSVWCEETGEGWQKLPGTTWRSARHLAATLLQYWEGYTFVIYGDK